MYSIDGVPLKNSTYGWRLKRDNTNPFGPISRSLADFNTSGRDGTIQTRGFTATPTITLNVTTPLAYLDDLRQLFRLGSVMTLTADTSQALTVELVTLTVQPWALVGSGIYMVSAILRVPSVNWRDVVTTDYGPYSFGNGSVVTPFTPSTAPVRDSLICIKGAVTNPVVYGQLGTYIAYNATVATNNYLTIDTATGRAFTGASPFQQLVEVTSFIQNGRGPYFLEMVGSSNPATLGTPLTLAGTAISGATITIRGRNAYDR